MANPDDLKTLQQGVDAWNAWRKPYTTPDLSGADLSGADLNGADLSSANLSGAMLRKADLRKANLSGADLSGAALSRADRSDGGATGCEMRGRRACAIGGLASRRAIGRRPRRSCAC